MTFRYWHEVEKVLAAVTTCVTKEQQELAKLAGINLPSNTPKVVAAALLRVALAEQLGLVPSNALTDRYEARIEALRPVSGPAIAPKTDEEAAAWLLYLRLVRRRESLIRLKLEEGDVVETNDGALAEISSIGEDGRVFFKGGRGFRAWPDTISLVARRDDDSQSARMAQQEARNTATRRASRADWSVARRNDLSDFAVENTVSEDDVIELENIIISANDERPIQKFLEKNPHLLTVLLGGIERYCIPQKRLGSEYVPDFIIGEIDSLGVRWVLIEIETPKSGIYLDDGCLLDEKARKGVSQIIDWRNWLSSNIAYARQRRSENGLGLFDIREKSDGVVIVGRRSQMPDTTDAQRTEYRQSNNIAIHTYDWLLDSLRGILRHQGPPASNPHLIHWTER
jgi:hypothetical protein